MSHIIEQIVSQLSKSKRIVNNQIQTKIFPHLTAHPNFTTGPIDCLTPLSCWLFEPIEIDGYKIKTVMGFIENGVVVDTCYGGLVFENLDDLPIEDLLKLTELLEKML